MGVDAPPVVSVNGSVSGTVSLYEYLTGPAPKRAFVTWNNYKSGAAQTLILPVPFTFQAQFLVSETQGQTIEFLSSGTAQTCSVMNSAFNAGSGGTQTPQTFTKSWSFGHVRTGFDTIRFTFTTTAASGQMTLEGY